jgi:hypothetical protein
LNEIDKIVIIIQKCLFFIITGNVVVYDLLRKFS